MENEDNDIELLAGQVWNAPPVAPDKYWPFSEQEVARMGEFFGKVFDETMMQFLKPQAEVVLRAPLPEESELLHEAPHYPYLLPKKGGAE